MLSPEVNYGPATTEHSSAISLSASARFTHKNQQGRYEYHYLFDDRKSKRCLLPRHLNLKSVWKGRENENEFSSQMKRSARRIKRHIVTRLVNGELIQRDEEKRCLMVVEHETFLFKTETFLFKTGTCRARYGNPIVTIGRNGRALPLPASFA